MSIKITEEGVLLRFEGDRLTHMVRKNGGDLPHMYKCERSSFEDYKEVLKTNGEANPTRNGEAKTA